MDLIDRKIYNFAKEKRYERGRKLMIVATLILMAAFMIWVSIGIIVLNIWRV